LALYFETMTHILAFFRFTLLIFLFLITSILVVCSRLFGREAAHAAMRFGVFCMGKTLGLSYDIIGNRQKYRQLILVNHPSYIDIMFINLIKHPTSLIAASNFKNWPFIGWFGRALEVIWIERHNRRAGVEVLREAESRFRKNMCIMTSPEGRTSGTHDIYPVKPGLFQLAIGSNVPITFMCFKYMNKMVPYYHSLKSGFVKHFLKHFWNVLRQPVIKTEITFSKPQFFNSVDEAIEAFYSFNKQQLNDFLFFKVPVDEEFLGEALTRLDPNILSFEVENKEELLS
jgi:1-acyl-sn-glycerol-3-phosphate acyltransferase